MVKYMARIVQEPGMEHVRVRANDIRLDRFAWVDRTRRSNAGSFSNQHVSSRNKGYDTFLFVDAQMWMTSPFSVSMLKDKVR